MSAWINVEYYVLSSMPSLALNSIISQSSSRQPGRADRLRLLDINSNWWWSIIVKITIRNHIWQPKEKRGRETVSERERNKACFEFSVKKKKKQITKNLRTCGISVRATSMTVRYTHCSYSRFHSDDGVLEVYRDVYNSGLFPIWVTMMALLVFVFFQVNRQSEH